MFTSSHNFFSKEREGSKGRRRGEVKRGGIRRSCAGREVRRHNK